MIWWSESQSEPFSGLQNLSLTLRKKIAMQITPLDPRFAKLGQRAMASVARASENGMDPSHRTLLAAAERMLLHTGADLASLAPIEPSELSLTDAPADQRRQLVRGLVVMSLAAGPTSDEQAALLTAYAAALDVDEPAVDVMNRLAHKEMLLFRLDFYRHSHLRDYMGNQYRNQGGILGVAKGVLGMRGLIADANLAARFDAFGELPENTLGYGFFKMYADRGFSFPGRKDGFPMGALFHDFAHLLSGYDTTPEGELCAAAFQAGFRRNEDAFFTLLFAVLTHTAGMNMTPLEQPVLLGRIGEEGLAEAMLDALRRGSQMTVDIGVDWDFWPLVAQPLAEARAQLGVAPPEVPIPDAARFDCPPHLATS